jgi:FtsH-binding integral membrane protein
MLEASGKTGLKWSQERSSDENKLRKVMFLFGLVLLFSGVISEAMYIATSNVAYASTVVSNSYLVLGIILILVGFIFTLSGARIPKIRVP